MDFYKQYKSGLKLVAAKLDNFYTVSFGVFVNVGSVMENAKNNGYSHFIEHLLFKGTERRTALQISEEIDDIGANLNAFTSKDCTCFFTKSASADLEKCIDVLSDMYFNATFPQDELQREKAVVLEEIKMCDDTPDDLSQDAIASALFNGQPLGQTILGNPRNIEYSDRHSIQNFKKKHYISANTVISVAGNFDFEKLDKLVETYFESNFEPSVAIGQEPQVHYTNKFVHRFKDIEQVHLEMAVGGYSINSPKRYAMSVLSSTLGGGLSSRLFQTIREKHGLVYSVYSYPSSYVNGGSLEIYAGLSPQNIKKVCNLIRDEIQLFVDKGITPKELYRAKIQATNGLYSTLESNMTLMRLYGRSMLKNGTLFNPQNEIECYKSVDISSVNEVARELFSQQYASSYVGRECDDFDFVSKIGKTLLD